jgi:nitrate/nitrite-specific signal transduction histidine kinase
VLRVISSSPGELGPVFDVILESAARLCRAAFGSLLLKESKVFRRVAVHNPPLLFAEFHKKTPIVQPQQIRELRTLIETNRPVHVADAAATDTDSAIVKYAGGRTLLIVPASTKSLGGRVEIRIRNNGTGIPPDVKEKMFDPFFTTKPAGEGTGLGLSISHDIIVKQHGGSIEVKTRPGGFTEISVTLPRAVTGKRV